MEANSTVNGSTFGNCSGTSDWVLESNWIDNVATTVNCMIGLAGLFMNGLVARVLISHSTTSLDVVQLSQCIGILLEAIVALPMYFYSRYLRLSLKDSYLHYTWSMDLFTADWIFQCCSMVLTVVMRTLQILRLSRHEILSRGAALGWMAMFFLGSLLIPFTEGSLNTLALDGAEEVQLPNSIVSKYTFLLITGVSIGVTGLCNLAVGLFLRRTYQVGFNTMHLKRAVDTLTIGFASCLLGQVK